MKIYKYEMKGEENKILRIIVPSGAEFLKVVIQNERLVAYYLVNPDHINTKEDHFYIAETGKYIPPLIYDGYSYLDCFMFLDGHYVLHVWRAEDTDRGE